MLGVGVTLGIIAQTVALIPALRAAGLRLRPRFDLRGTGLGHAARLARWTFLYVVCNQLVLIVVVQLASGTGNERDYPSYIYAFLLWQLPHAVIAVSVITALLPAMSRAAADGRIDELRRQLDRGLRLTISVLVPAAVAYLVLGRSLATIVFAHGRTSAAEARFIGILLARLRLRAGRVQHLPAAAARLLRPAGHPHPRPDQPRRQRHHRRHRPRAVRRTA